MASKKTIDTVKESIERSGQRNFLESIEIAINIKDVDLSIPKNRINEEIILPNGRGKPIKIVLFGSGELAIKAKSVVDRVIQPEEMEELADDKASAKKMANEHTFFIAEAPMMPTIGKQFGTILGPRGKMPKPIPPTADPGPIVTSLRNTITIRSKDKRTFHAPVGTKEMDPEKVADNIELVMKRVLAKLERGKQNIASIYIKTTMGKAVRLM